ncbi:uncharacterized protein LOC109833782 isoform X1 [Asparagus officinalis]|uniref:uncharacterized protein LOC109833782 isoform X1 n=1 Tax=Asparagus officinalis TaxID=4686 RepID=UPI00098E58A1|nr:uncharacterized protein LOC109833782 isoform X1 [Asparagus officinalis]
MVFSHACIYEAHKLIFDNILPMESVVQRRGISLASKCVCCANHQTESLNQLFVHSPAGKGTGLKGEIIALSTGAFCLHPTSAQTDTKTPCGLDLETCFLLATASKMERNELLPQSCSSLSTIVTLTQIFG